ncbi:hypothetical protein BGZ65_004715 [Modicella reniformis]|uniref:Uncharacterized protein n=1 Tax=Modicella reniformis TaxID=1440133 RepID=A0A9P6IM92_9FUNG|nr:hypothetical protein BGZ65_004715 [Modicella reniformis]
MVKISTSHENNPNQSKQVVSVLTLLLDRPDLKEANYSFIEGLLKLDSGAWIPYADMSLNPIARAIKNKDEQSLNILIDYCIKCAKTRHPAYLTPVEQCLAQLSKDYPEIVASVFLSTSYIPTHNYEYVASHAITISNKFQDFLDGNKKPVFILPFQLPTTTPSSSYFFMNTNRDLYPGSESRFAPKQNVQSIHKKRNYNIYVSPFQFRPIAPLIDYQKTRLNPFSKRLDKASVFTFIKDRDFFDNMAIASILRFKWYKFGFKYWSRRFFLVLMFFILMMIITAKQISVSAVKKGEVPTADEIAARYLPGWRPVFIVTIVLGLILCAYEIPPMFKSPITYFRSPFNWVDLAAYISPVVGCTLFLKTVPGTIDEDTGIDGGPSQIWIMAFSILFLYMNMVSDSWIVSSEKDTSKQYANSNAHHLDECFMKRTVARTTRHQIPSDHSRHHFQYHEEDLLGSLQPFQRLFSSAEIVAVLDTGVSNPSTENRFLVETSGAAGSPIQETQRTINDNIVALGKAMVERSRRQDEKLAEMEMLC